jgi:hypothetical protein
MKVLVGLVLSEATLPGLQTAVFSLCPHVAFSLCMYTFVESFSSIYDTNPVGLIPNSYDII